VTDLRKEPGDKKMKKSQREEKLAVQEKQNHQPPFNSRSGLDLSLDCLLFVLFFPSKISHCSCETLQELLHNLFIIRI